MHIAASVSPYGPGKVYVNGIGILSLSLFFFSFLLYTGLTYKTLRYSPTLLESPGIALELNYTLEEDIINTNTNNNIMPLFFDEMLH